jgi:MFS family permease
MYGTVAAVADYLRVGELRFELSEAEWRRLRLISLLPALALLFLAIWFLLETVHEPNASPSIDTWDRLYYFTAVTQGIMGYIGLAVLVVSGIGVVTRGHGAWALAFTIILLFIGFTAGFYASALQLFVGELDTFERKYHLNVAISATFTCCLLAAGYAFIAYRGLVASDWDDIDAPSDSDAQAVVEDENGGAA